MLEKNKRVHEEKTRDGCLMQKFITIVTGSGDMRTGHCANLTSSGLMMFPHGEKESPPLCVTLVSSSGLDSMKRWDMYSLTQKNMIEIHLLFSLRA